MIKNTNTMQKLVTIFHQKFGHPIAPRPSLPTLERFTNRKGWGSIEEAVEQLYTLSQSKEEFDETIDKLHKFLDDAKTKQLNKGLPVPTTEENEMDKITALADGLADELYFLLGDCVEAGIDIEPILQIVQNSNISKLFTDENGELYAKQNELGKVIKSPEFFEPEPFIKEEVLKQFKTATSEMIRNNGYALIEAFKSIAKK